MYDRRRIYSFILLIMLAGSLTLVLQKWVGDVTLYQSDLKERRLMIHEAILHNRLPPGRATWEETGSNGTNTRVAVVYLAESIHRASRVNIMTAYRLIDTVALFAALLLLFAHLRQSAPPAYALLGLLYTAAVLPLTYFFSYFHPYDRVSLLVWIALLMLLRSGRLVAFTVLLAASVPVKHDTILLPGLYFLSNVNRDNWPRVIRNTALMFAVSFGTWIALRLLLPGGYEERQLIVQMWRNLDAVRATLPAYPPLLCFSVPVILALIGLRWSDRFARASVAFGFLLLVPLVVLTNFIEVRAEMFVLVLMMPSALTALRILCEGDPGFVAAQVRGESRAQMGQPR